jgi:hypothetical protein
VGYIDYKEEDLKSFFEQDPEPLFYSGYEYPIGFIYQSKGSFDTRLLLELDYCEENLSISSDGFYLWLYFDWKLERWVGNSGETLVLTTVKDQGKAPFLIIHKSPCFSVELPYFSLGQLDPEKQPIEIDFAKLNKLLKTEPIVNTLEEVTYIAQDPKNRELELVIIPLKNICLVTIRLNKGGPVLTRAKYFDVTRIGYYQKSYDFGKITTSDRVGIWGDFGQDEPVQIKIDKNFSLYLPKWTWKEFRKRKGTLDD